MALEPPGYVAVEVLDLALRDLHRQVALAAGGAERTP